MAIEVVFEPSPQRLVCECGMTLSYMREDLRGSYRNFAVGIDCPLCKKFNIVKSTVLTKEGETK